MRIILIIGALLLLLGAPAALFFLSSSSVVELVPAVQALGPENTLNIRVANPHGARVVRVSLDQGQAHSSSGVEAPPDRWMFWRSKLEPKTYQVKISADPRIGFKSGPARLTIEAVSNDFRGRTDTVTADIPITLEPPRLSVDSHQHYINQGGAELVTFTVSGHWTEAGVRVGNYTFRSFPMPGAASPNERFCLFAFPWDVPATTQPIVFARNDAGQEVTGTFWNKITPKNWRHRDLPLTDGFIEKVVNELDPGGQGSPLDRYLKINREMRKQNNATLAALRLQSEPRALWSPPFQQLSNSQVEAQFADIRSYTYEGKKVDEQTHLGFDLSKVARAPVVASNSGKVVLAGPLGIYGNCVVVDHGYTLQSIYAHLSQISVKAGDMVEKGQQLGNSGATGLAGGDHLHFSMQIDGVQVNPVEWWDNHWIQDRVLSKLPLPAAQSSAGKQ